MELCYLLLLFLVAVFGRTLDWNQLVSLRTVCQSITKKIDCGLRCEARKSCLDCLRTAAVAGV